MLVGGGGGSITEQKMATLCSKFNLKTKHNSVFHLYWHYNGQVLLHIVLGITVSFNDTRQFELP